MLQWKEKCGLSYLREKVEQSDAEHAELIALREYVYSLRDEGEIARTFAVTRSGDLPRLTGTTGVEIKVLSPITMAGKLELYFLTLEPGAVLASEAHEPGSCELITVISGAVEVEAGRNSARLESGDVLNYQCDTSHRISNPGGSAATLHMVVNFKGASM